MPGTGLPDQLPPFDIPAALARTTGKPQLLRKLILRFRDTYASAIPDMRRLLVEGGHEEAQRLAHSLRGTAGTLEAGELSVAAAAVEHAFRDGEMTGMGSLIDALERELTPALCAASTLETVTVATPPPLMASRCDGCDIAAILADLRNHIATNDLKARKLFARMSGNLIGLGADAEVGELGNRLDHLDFPGALTLLDHLADKLGLFEEKS
jgi:two-component system sensor histidine kinase/response regulator